VELYGRGQRVIGLGVDAENPTGATRLYNAQECALSGPRHCSRRSWPTDALNLEISSDNLPAAREKLLADTVR
jgi:hypothetical protein